MFRTLRVRDIILFFVSVVSFIGLLIYIPFADAEIPDHTGLLVADKDELSLNDSDKDLYSVLNKSYEEDKEGVYTFYLKQDDITESKEELSGSEYPTQRGIYVVREGMPRNTRHLKEGYWIGSLPDISNILSMKEHGIKIILTVTNTKRSWIPVKNKIKELGIEHIIIPVGSRFPKDTTFYDTLLNYDPNEIFIHCDHGADRSGTFIAYLLARRNHWTIQRALLAMVSPNKVDVNGLKFVLKQNGYEVTEEDFSIASIYSGPQGGLKVRNEGYQRLVATMLTTYRSTEGE